jgi:hypothetical protein
MSGLQQLIFKTFSRQACARLSLDRFRFVGGADQRAAWQRSALDPDHDLAPGKVIRSCPVASFNLLSKIDPADTISASAARYLIRSKFLPLAGATLPDASAGAALQIWGASPIGARSVRGSLMSEMGHSEKSALK